MGQCAAGLGIGGEVRVFPGLSEMVIFASQHQGRAAGMALKALKIQQALAVLSVAPDIGGGQTLDLPQQGFAKDWCYSGLLQAQWVE